MQRERERERERPYIERTILRLSAFRMVQGIEKKKKKKIDRSSPSLLIPFARTYVHAGTEKIKKYRKRRYRKMEEIVHREIQKCQVVEEILK